MSDYFFSFFSFLCRKSVIEYRIGLHIENYRGKESEEHGIYY